MPRRGEETSPAPRRSPRAAVKASASPSPIIRESRSRSTAKQTTPKTRVASPSPKRRASSKNTKTEKDETPKQSSRAAAVSTKKVADKSKKSPASAKTPTSSSGKSRSRGRQQKNVEEESEVDDEEEEEETKPSKSGSRAGRGKAPEPKKERAVPVRKGRALVKDESEEEADEAAKTKSEKKNLSKKSDPEQVDDSGGGGRTTSRSRRTSSKQSEEVAAIEEQSAPVARTARSRNRGQGKKAEDKTLPEASAITESRSGRGRRSAGQTIVDEPKPSKEESVVQEEELEEEKPTKNVPTKQGDAESQNVEIPKESLNSSDQDNTFKGRKRGNVDVEKSPEKSPSSKRQRKFDGSSNESEVLEPAPVQDEFQVSVSPSKVKASVITPKEMQKEGDITVTKQTDDIEMSETINEVAKSETMDVDDKEEAEVTSKISPKASPVKPASGSPHEKKESLSLPSENRNQSKLPLITIQEASELTVSPPKTLHSSATVQSTTPASANMSSLSSSQFHSKFPSVPVTSAATGKPIVPPSSSVGGEGIQSVSPQKHTLGSSNIVSAQLQAQPDSSHGQLLSNISPQTILPSLTITSNIQSSQSLHPQKNISPTKSSEVKKPAFIPGILNKVSQPSSSSGQPIDPKAQLSTSNISCKAPDSSSSMPSAKSLFTAVSKTPMETQSKVPIQIKPNLQATIPVISSTAPVPSSKTISSTLISGSPSSPIVSKVVGLAQPKIADSKAQSTGTVSGSPLVTVGSVQRVDKPSTGVLSQPADSVQASSTSEDVINGAGAKASSVQGQPLSETNKKRKMDSDPPNEENPESKKARVSPDDSKSLIANGSKDASRVNQASKISQDQSATKTEVMDIDPSPSTEQDSNGNEVSLKDYVIIDKSEVPHKDSPEVKESLPKMPLSNPTTAQSVGLGSSQTLESSSSTSSSSGLSGSNAESTNFKDILLNRTFKQNPALFSSPITEKSKQFSVVTYNILADCHFRTNNKMDRYSADEKPHILLPGRHKRLMAELCYVDADIVCLQEVEPEYYSKTLSPDMQKLGYEGFFKKRVHENFDEGETTFYKTSRFSDPENTAYSLKQLIDKDIQELSLSEDVKESVRKFMCRPDVLLVTRLRCKNTGKFITVGNIHVNWGQFKLPNLQCVQIARAIREVVNRAGNDSSPHVICGDFNSFPQAPGYQLASEGYLSDSMIHILQSSKTMEMPDGTKSALIDHLWQGFQHTSSSLTSAYAVVQGQEPELTTLTTHTRTCLDYVFYSSSSLEAVGVLQVPDKQIVLDCKFIPNKIFPSDHLSLKAVLAFK